MTLLELRTQLLTDSGRYDLIDGSDYSDNGMNVKIRAACKWLDITTQHKRQIAVYKYDISAGEYKVEVPNVRSILRAYAYRSADGRRPLTELSFEEMLNKYTNDPDTTNQGVPAYYCNSIINLQHSQNYASSAAYLAAVAAGTAPFTMDYETLMFGDNHEYSGIWIMPPADDTYTISLQGEFFSKPLTLDADYNFWSVAHPDLLTMAVRRQLEIDARNTEGRKDWEEAIRQYKIGIEFDMINEQIAHTNQMEG